MCRWAAAREFGRVGEHDNNVDVNTDLPGVDVDGSYPSVNTCEHYVKIPEYSSKSVLREQLLKATAETKGFDLN